MQENEYEDEYDVASDIYNLTAAYTAMLDIDDKIMGEDQKKIIRIRKRLLQSLDYYTNLLPVTKKEEK